MLRGWYFDGETARAQRVLLKVRGERLHLLHPADGSLLRDEPLAGLSFPEAFENAPRLLALPAGGVVEVDDHIGVLAAFGDRARRDGVVAALQRRWHASLAALAVLVGALVFGYTHGLPAAAEWLAFHLPDDLRRGVGEEVLAVLDQTRLAPSRLDAERQAAIRARFAALAARAAPGVEASIEFRDGSGLDGVEGGFNAFALPGGTIVLLDGIPWRTSEAQTLAVLGHELGHVRHRHGLRNLLQAAGLAAVGGLLWGDVAGVASTAPVVLGVLSYSRDFEREADDFAVAFLQAGGLGVEPLVEVLGILDSAPKECGPEAPAAPPSLFDTHPVTEERIRRLTTAGG